EILAGERLERTLSVESEPIGRRANCADAGTTGACELAQDPKIEAALRLRQAGATLPTKPPGRDPRRREGRHHARRQLTRFGASARAHLAASANASRTQLSSGCSETPCSLR